MGKHKKPLKTKGIIAKGFSTDSSDISKQKLRSDFNNYIKDHSWADAVRAWKKLSLNEASNSGATTKREELKRLIFEGRDYMESGDHNQAAYCYCKALTIDPNNLDCLRNLAIIDLATDKAEQALELINRALAIRKDISSLWNVKIQCLGSLGRSTEAKALLDIAINQHGLERKALLLDLVTRLSKPNPDEAVRIARSLLEEYAGELDEGLFSLVGITRQYGCFELEDSINWWEESKSLSPSVIPSVLLNLLAIAGTEEESRSLALLQRKFYDWCLELCDSDSLQPLIKTRVSNRPIRIGVVSGDFCNHVVARFLCLCLKI
jgi:tetratricopeptide (TPR) repeat protein